MKKSFVLLFLVFLVGVGQHSNASQNEANVLFNEMNDLLAQVGPIFPERNLFHARDMVYQCFLNRVPCPTDGNWMPGRSARLRVSKVFRPNLNQKRRARYLEAKYQRLMYLGKPVTSRLILDRMNDLLGEIDGPFDREDSLQRAQGAIVRCFINQTCTSFVDYGLFSSRKFRPSFDQQARARLILKKYRALK